MIGKHLVYYLGSKLSAAILNLITMALFVRLAGAETYGAYLIVLAWAYVVYGVTMQWMRFSFFGCFREEEAASLVATYLRSLGLGFIALMGLASLGVASGLVALEFAVAVVALIIGLASYDALHEMARTRLNARAVAMGVMTRAVLMMTFGTSALLLQATPLSLALAVGSAHLGAAIPLLYATADKLDGRWSRQTMTKLWQYGRPLVPAYGLDSVSLQLDRLLLARFSTLDVVGQYGAVADLVRQSMIVVSEAIAGAYIAVARRDAAAGRIGAAASVLGQAFLAYTALTAFGAAVILRFDRLILDTMFGAGIGAAVEPVLALIVASEAARIFRGYYFGQVVYLTTGAQVLLVSNTATVSVVAIAGVLLVPLYGMAGAAGAMLLGHIAGCLVYIWSWRDHYALRLPYAKAAAVAGMAAAAYLATGLLDSQLGSTALAVVANAAIFAMAMLIAGRAFNILSFNDLVAKGLSLLRGRTGAPVAVSNRVAKDDTILEVPDDYRAPPK